MYNYCQLHVPSKINSGPESVYLFIYLILFIYLYIYCMCVFKCMYGILLPWGGGGCQIYMLPWGVPNINGVNIL